MRRKILSMVTVVMMLFVAVGCGGGSNTDANTNTNGTKVNFSFKSNENSTFQKVSDITQVLIDVKKGAEFIYEEKSATKSNGTWSANLSLNKNDTPYTFTTRAYKGDELLYQGTLQTADTLPSRLVLTLEAVSPTSSVTLLPSIKKIESSIISETKIKLKFTIVNLQSDEVRYTLLSKRITNISKELAKKSQKGETEVGDAGSFNPSGGSLNFTNKNEAVFTTTYTKPINPPVGLDSSNLFSSDYIVTSLVLTNSKDDVVTTPFIIPTYADQEVVINFPPEVNKVNVLDEGSEHTVKLDVSDSGYSDVNLIYEWEVLTGSTIVGETATQNPLKLEGYDVSVNGSLCVSVKVSDPRGASTKVGYCLHGKGFIREGNVVTDVVRKVQWQDDEAVKSNSRPWLRTGDNGQYLDYNQETQTYTPTGRTAIPYCQELVLDGYFDWRVPNEEELKSILDKRFNPTIDQTFSNIGESTAENLNIYYTTTTPPEYLDELGIYKNMLPFRKERIDDNVFTFYTPENKIYIRCIRDSNITTSNLETIYGALKLTTNLDKQVYSQTDTLKRFYTFKNESKHILDIPQNTKFSTPYYLIGSLQFWIERLGSDSNIPSISSNIARSGNMYAAGGFIVPTRKIIKPLDVAKSSSSDYSLNNYPKGDYRIYIDYQKIGGSLIERQALDFTIQ